MSLPRLYTHVVMDFLNIMKLSKDTLTNLQTNMLQIRNVDSVGNANTFDIATMSSDTPITLNDGNLSITISKYEDHIEIAFDEESTAGGPVLGNETDIVNSSSDKEFLVVIQYIDSAYNVAFVINDMKMTTPPGPGGASTTPSTAMSFTAMKLLRPNDIFIVMRSGGQVNVNDQYIWHKTVAKVFIVDKEMIDV